MTVAKNIRYDIEMLTIKELKEYLNQFKDSDMIHIEYDSGYYGVSEVIISVERQTELPKYKIGDKVKIKSEPFFRDLNTKEDISEKESGFIKDMYQGCSKEAEIVSIKPDQIDPSYKVYTLSFSNKFEIKEWAWNEWMFDKVEGK